MTDPNPVTRVFFTFKAAAERIKGGEGKVSFFRETFVSVLIETSQPENVFSLVKSFLLPVWLMTVYLISRYMVPLRVLSTQMSREKVTQELCYESGHLLLSLTRFFFFTLLTDVKCKLCFLLPSFR